MTTPTTTPPTQTDAAEQGIAHALEALQFLEASVTDDLRAAQIVHRAHAELTERLQAIRYNAYARMATARSAARTKCRAMKRRHQR